jgi:hypothetical protein
MDVCCNNYEGALVRLNLSKLYSRLHFSSLIFLKTNVPNSVNVGIPITTTRDYSIFNFIYTITSKLVPQMCFCCRMYAARALTSPTKIVLLSLAIFAPSVTD